MAEEARPPASPGTVGAPIADEATVRALLRDQRPDLADGALVPGPTGWDNTHWLLDGGLAVRLPRREVAVPLVANEVRVLAAMGDRLPLGVPVPVHVGTPAGGWPWPWTIIRWFGGDRADLAYPPADAREHAEALGGFLAALHVPAPADAPTNPFRGVPLADRAERTGRVLAGLAASGSAGDDGLRALRRTWDDGLAATPHRDVLTWIHGDLHPGNQVVVDGALVAVVDWGDAAGGDPAVDLATAWWSLPVDAHGVFRAAYGGVGDDAWVRARAWAAAIAAFILHEGVAVGDPAIVSIARRTVHRLMVD